MDPGLRHWEGRIPSQIACEGTCLGIRSSFDTRQLIVCFKWSSRKEEINDGEINDEERGK